MISVILPVYQVENYIVNCLKSLSRQTFKNFEIIIVNDGTKDRSIIFAEEYLKASSLTYYIYNQKNKGVSAARNTGINHANGEWVICIDPDDVVQKEFLEYLYEANKINNTIASTGSYQMVSEENLFKVNDSQYSHSVYNKNEIVELFLVRKIKIISPAILVKKDLIVEESLFYNEKMRFSEDVHWIWRLLIKLENISYVHTEIYNYNRRPNSTMTSSNVDKILTGYKGFLEYNNELNNFEFYIKENIILDRWVFGALRSSAKIMTYKNFKKLSMLMSYEKHMKPLADFPDYRVRLLSKIFVWNKKLFYFIGRVI